MSLALRKSRPFWTELRPLHVINNDYVGMDAFDDLFSKMGLSNASNMESVWPRIDVHETEKGFVVKAEVPGINEKDINVELEKGLLTINGEKKIEEESEEEKNVHRREIFYGKFKKSIDLGNEILDENLQASLKNGVLQIKIPKKLSTKSRVIPVVKE